ncbi:MAG: hypothetical protein WB992_06265 [Bryobacteraceae bacterium]
MQFGLVASLGLAITLGSFAPIPARAQQGDFTWLVEYRDQGENKLAGDKRFIPFLQSQLPSTPLPSWENQPVNEAAGTFLWGVPGYIEVRHNRYFSASGCPAHACVARALLWVDTQSDLVVFIATGEEEDNRNKATRNQYHVGSANLYLATKAALDPAALPDELRGAIIRWLHLEGVLNVGTITLLTPSGAQPVTTDQLCWTGRCAYTRWD